MKSPINNSEPAPSQPIAGNAVLSLSSMDGYLHLPSNSRLERFQTNDDRPTIGGAVFLDRDGVIVEDVHFLTEPDQLNILPKVVAGLRDLQDRFPLIVITNQSGVARGLLSEEKLKSIHWELVRLLWEQGVWIDALYYCPHLPDSPIEAYQMPCDCRKPAPGMLVRAAADWGIDLARSYMVGDMPRDIQAGQAAGVKTVLIGGGVTKASDPVQSACDMVEAADLILYDALHHIGEVPCWSKT